jgi:hypothetical protein
MSTIHLLVGSKKPIWLEIERNVPLAVIHSALARIGMIATEEDIKLPARIKTVATEKEAIALARARNERKLVEWPSMAIYPTQGGAT